MNGSSKSTTKAKAIEASLHHASNIFKQKVKQSNNIVIFSDAKSVLEALRNEDIKDMTIRKLTILGVQMSTMKVKV